MRGFIHTVTDTEFIRDWDGEDFPDLEIAAQETTQVARDLMAEQLRKGRPLPVRWKVLLALADDTVLMSLSFSQLIPAIPDPSLGGRLRSLQGNQLKFRRVRALPICKGGPLAVPDRTDQRPARDVHMLHKSLLGIALMRMSIVTAGLQVKSSFRAIRESNELLDRMRREGF